MDFKDFITKRHAVRRFTDRQIAHDLVQTESTKSGALKSPEGSHF